MVSIRESSRFEVSRTVFVKSRSENPDGGALGYGNNAGLSVSVADSKRGVLHRDLRDDRNLHKGTCHATLYIELATSWRTGGLKSNFSTLYYARTS
jgi:hypothetical protein